MSIGKILKFNFHVGHWKMYVERLEQYFIANKILDERQVPTLISVMGAECYELLANLCSPHKPASKTFRQLTEILENYLQSKPSTLSERYKFRHRKQNSKETISEFVAALKGLSKTCEFGSGLEESLRDQLICGISNETIRERLFKENEIEFRKAYRLAVSMELAEKYEKEVKGRVVPVVKEKAVGLAIAGTERDAFTGQDAGTGLDAGTGRDAGTGPNAGTGPDAGTGRNVGTGPDAGTRRDWGTQHQRGMNASRARYMQKRWQRLENHYKPVAQRPQYTTVHEVHEQKCSVCGANPYSSRCQFTQDSGTGRHAGTVRDAGTGQDAGIGKNVGTLRDVGIGRDAGTERDAGTGPNACTGPDAVTGQDAGIGRDVGIGRDAGIGRGAGTGRDAGTGQDAGIGRDACTGPDAGTGRDAVSGRDVGKRRNWGTGRDAGTGRDEGSVRDEGTGRGSGTRRWRGMKASRVQKRWQRLVDNYKRGAQRPQSTTVHEQQQCSVCGANHYSSRCQFTRYVCRVYRHDLWQVSPYLVEYHNIKATASSQAENGDRAEGDKKTQKSEESVKGLNMSGIKKKLNAQKMDVRNKRNRRKTNNRMKKLFGQLRDQSNITLDSSQNSTVILLDDTIVSPNRKRKLSDCSIIEHETEPSKCMKSDNLEPVLHVDDDELVTNTDPSTSTNKVVLNPNTAPCSSKTPRKLFAPPMNCSTPISKSNTNIAINNNADTVQNFNVDSNMTKEINRDSFLTIDLTTETVLNQSSISKSQFNTVIDLDNTQESHDCTFVSMSNASLSMSGDSDVTVLKNDSRKRINRVVNGIAKLRASEKDRLLEMITKKIFSGCKLPERVKSNLSTIKENESKGTETVENSYIKEVILGEKPSRNSIGSNIYNPGKDNNNKTGLRMIVIDGSNVAMEHGKGRVFSVRGLKICIDYFLKRGHVVKAFVPRFRCKFGKSSDPRLLDDLERRGLVVYTPSREIQGKMVTPYDDRYIVQCAAEFDGVIVSGDQYRDLLCENPRWRSVIETRLLPFTWVNDMIMFPKDPLGRNGPTLEVFLRHPVTKAMPSIVL